ncbi:uncharacterized protein K489DRAFT_420069 [Dissoconium aciculare CBS 342.82]|uniref:Secreted protein n=1 Tax=Dissoconium aciculare CBS 342.82 TaxID=1314786 RepID=A0A6J3MIL3_9PEZI|nr:uncharacterized protein K489DRAFT_420069 [Dissoconium aciculare CBS 342.82]KAF1826752.1 hypothetical protein K489DRAFT_420069 [Dissoconium aciculare CBS 342.82]
MMVWGFLLFLTPSSSSQAGLVGSGINGVGFAHRPAPKYSRVGVPSYHAGLSMSRNMKTLSRPTSRYRETRERESPSNQDGIPREKTLANRRRTNQKSVSSSSFVHRRDQPLLALFMCPFHDPSYMMVDDSLPPVRHPPVCRRRRQDDHSDPSPPSPNLARLDASVPTTLHNRQRGIDEHSGV